MKKLFVCTGALLLLAVSPAGAQFFISSAPAHEVAAAQKADSACFRRADGKPVAIETVERDSTGIDTLRRIDTVDSDLIRLRDGGRDGNMILEVAGFGLTLGHTPMQRMELKKPRVWFNAFSNIELGFTQLVGVDYSGYASGEKGFLDQRLGSSFHFSFSAVQLRLALNRSRSLCLGVGMQYTLDNYRLSDNTITLGNDGGCRSGRAGRTRRQVESRHLLARHSRSADLHSGETPTDHGRRLFRLPLGRRRDL